MTRRDGLALLLTSAALAQDGADRAILEALDRFMAGWNSRDPEKYADALHFPHVVLDDGRVTEYATRQQFVARGKGLWASAPPDWDHSEWTRRQIVQRLGDTVHATGTWVRKNKAGKTIYTADVLYVVLKRDGAWKIFARSGSRGLQRDKQ